MPHVITQNCCNDAACVEACPVDCIHPRPDEPGFATAEMLYIDPKACIDCGACIPMCPVEAIAPAEFLEPAKARYAEINAYFAAANTTPMPRPPLPFAIPGTGAIVGPLRVAVVGAGPAGLFAAEHLLTQHGLDAEVDVFDRLPTPYGLIRAGVAPDHQATKSASNPFRWTATRPGFAYRLGVEVGRDVTHDELLEHYHAVIYAVGATTDRKLDVPGEQLPGSYGATEFVNWYNGHPDHADDVFDLSGERAVIIGNGNVALDVARILAVDPESLATTDIADRALESLRASRIREVVVVGRRGPAEAAYTGPELLGLSNLDGVDLIIDEAELGEDNADDSVPLKVKLAREFAGRPEHADHRRIILRYLASPVEITGTGRVEGVRLVRNELRKGADGTRTAHPTAEEMTIDAGLVLRAVGHRGVALPGVPFDEQRGVIPNDGGRVIDDDGTPTIGVYTTGWIKRGSTGVIGTNKKCSEETVAELIADARNGRLARPTGDHNSMDCILRERRPDWVDVDGWNAIDEYERMTGQAEGRLRVKLTRIHDQFRVAHSDDSIR